MAINIVEDIIPVTKVREQIGSVIERARETKRPIIVTQNGSAAVVIIDAAQYQKERQERDLFRAILIGEDAIRAGKVVRMEEVEARLDAILAEE
ncbi:MAG: type II toxin-antitoxin system Phd/YefM family antitoxin [Thermomicrobiales bacterium]